MKRALSFFVCVCLLLSLAGCSLDIFGVDVKVNVPSRTVNLSDEHRVFEAEADSEKSGYRLVIENIFFDDTPKTTLAVTPADGPAHVSVDCSREFENYGLKVEISGDTITVSADDNVRFDTDFFAVTVAADISEYRIDGGYSFTVETVPADRFEMELNGAARGEVTGIDAKTARLTVDGAASVELSGGAGELSCTLNGAGAVDAEELAVQDSEVTINGAGSVTLSAEENLKAEINGVGSITYYGDPKVDKSVAGLGTVKKAG